MISNHSDNPVSYSDELQSSFDKEKNLRIISVIVKWKIMFL